jgi:RNA polymerase sigma factor (sigma-70 family)
VDGSDVDLLRAWQSGDQAAGGELLRRHLRAVHQFFAGKVDVVAVDDLAQRTFEAVARLRDDVRLDAGFRAFLFGVARLELLRHLDEWRRRGSRFDPLETSLEALGSGPVSAVVEIEVRERIAAALRRLPIDFQLALELHYWDDLPLAEIAAALEIPVGTVKSRLSRGRAMLARELGAADDGDTAQLERWMLEARARG